MTSMAQDGSQALPRPVYRAPDLPDRARRDWGRIVDRALLGVGAVVTFGVGNWSIATVLHEAGAPWVAAVGAAGVFDLIAVSAAVRVHRLRLTPHRAYGAQIVMLLSLVASMVVNAAHGWAMGSWTVATVLGAVPLAFEIPWAMQHGIKPWAVRRQFKTEARELVRRDVHAALYGMIVDPAPTRDTDDFPTAGTAVVTERVTAHRNPPKRALSAAPVPAMTNIVPAMTADTGTEAGTVPAMSPRQSFGFTGTGTVPATTRDRSRERDTVTVTGPGTAIGRARELLAAGTDPATVTDTLVIEFPDRSRESLRGLMNKARRARERGVGHATP